MLGRILALAAAVVALGLTSAPAANAQTTMGAYDYYGAYDVGFYDDGVYDNDWFYDYYDYGTVGYEPFGYDYDVGRDSFGWEDDTLF